MKTGKSYYLICLFLFPQLLWSDIQFKPLSSPENHDLSAGLSVPLKKTGKTNKLGSSLEYTLYFPKIISLYPPDYKNIFIPGLSLGINSSEIGEEGYFYDTCKKNKKLYFLAWHIGLKGKIPYSELIQPFGELGFTRSLCYARNFSKTYTPQTKFKYYLSYGLFLSLKILNKIAIYSLDNDYGINNIGIKAECRHYYTESEKNNPLNVCQFGLQVSF